MSLIETLGVQLIIKGTPCQTPRVRQLFELLRRLACSYYPEG